MRPLPEKVQALVFRTSNAYQLRDPCESNIPFGTVNQDIQKEGGRRFEQLALALNHLQAVLKAPRARERRPSSRNVDAAT
jgi:hypothetical protein